MRFEDTFEPNDSFSAPASGTSPLSVQPATTIGTASPSLCRRAAPAISMSTCRAFLLAQITTSNCTALPISYCAPQPSHRTTTNLSATTPPAAAHTGYVFILPAASATPTVMIFESMWSLRLPYSQPAALHPSSCPHPPPATCHSSARLCAWTIRA